MSHPFFTQILFRRSALKLLAGSVLAIGLTGMLAACNKTDTGSAATTASQGTAGSAALLNVSYDVSREFYKDINAGYVQAAAQAGKPVDVQQSHGNAGSNPVRSTSGEFLKPGDR